MKGKRADAFRAGFKRGELFAQFGVKHAQPGGANESIVKLSNCLVMPPATAKRLAIALNEVLQQHEAENVPRHADPKADRLLRIVADLGTRYAYEHSFRVCRGALLTNRFLLSIDASVIADKPGEEIIGFCDRLGMPDLYIETAQENLSSAKFIHFGFEENETGRLYKVYLEFGDAGDDGAGVGSSTPDPYLLHLAFKWDISDRTRRVLTQYILHPSIGAREIEARLSRLYGDGECGESLRIARGVLELAASRGTDEDLQYLEVSEDESGRRSFDLNVYDVNLTVEDLHPMLVKMCQVHEVSLDRLDALYVPIKSSRFGHLAGGVHRDGRDFFNVYYGVEWHHG